MGPDLEELEIQLRSRLPAHERGSRYLQRSRHRLLPVGFTSDKVHVAFQPLHDFLHVRLHREEQEERARKAGVLLPKIRQVLYRIHGVRIGILSSHYLVYDSKKYLYVASEV